MIWPDWVVHPSKANTTLPLSNEASLRTLGAAKGQDPSKHSRSGNHSSFPERDGLEHFFLGGIVLYSIFFWVIVGKMQILTRFFPAQHQGETLLDGVRFIIQHTPKAYHNDVLVFDVVGCIRPNPKRVMTTIRGNIGYFRSHITEVVPVASDFSLRYIRPKVTIHQPWDDLFRDDVRHLPGFH